MALVRRVSGRKTGLTIAAPISSTRISRFFQLESIWRKQCGPRSSSAVQRAVRTVLAGAQRGAPRRGSRTRSSAPAARTRAGCSRGSAPQPPPLRPSSSCVRASPPARCVGKREGVVSFPRPSTRPGGRPFAAAPPRARPPRGGPSIPRPASRGRRPGSRQAWSFVRKFAQPWSTILPRSPSRWMGLRLRASCLAALEDGMLPRRACPNPTSSTPTCSTC